MYSLDINFLKDRNLDDASKTRIQKKTQTQQFGKNAPLIAGLAVMVLFPAVAGGFLLVVNGQNTELEKQIQELDAQISAINAQNQKIQQMEAKIAQVNAETNALVGVFNQIKPWSAILQDISDRLPPRVQIDSIQQGQSPKLTLVGSARSYNDVNDFLLTLQRSNFFKAKATRLQSAQLVDNPTKVEYSEAEQAENVTVELPKVVNYTITTELNNTPASKLLRELARKGDVGLVTRMETLKQKGVIQP